MNSALSSLSLSPCAQSESNPSEPEIPYKLNVCDLCDVYAVFNDPADRLISTALCDVSTTDNNDFFQHSMNFTNTAPACALIALEPTAECDSYVTIGLDCFDLADGTVGPADLALLLGAWGPCPPP